jgi:hypothetical protein
MQVDLAAIAQGVIKNNMGVGGIELRVRGKLQDGKAVFAETGQSLPVSGGPPSSSKPWLVFDAQGWQEGEPLTLVWKGEQDGPESR